MSAVDFVQFVFLFILAILKIFFDLSFLVVQGVFILLMFLLIIMILAVLAHNFCPKMQLCEFIFLVILGILMVLMVILIHLDLFVIVVQVIFMVH